MHQIHILIHEFSALFIILAGYLTVGYLPRLVAWYITLQHDHYYSNRAHYAAAVYIGVTVISSELCAKDKLLSAIILHAKCRHLTNLWITNINITLILILVVLLTHCTQLLFLFPDISSYLLDEGLKHKPNWKLNFVFGEHLFFPLSSCPHTPAPPKRGYLSWQLQIQPTDIDNTESRVTFQCVIPFDRPLSWTCWRDTGKW